MGASRNAALFKVLEATRRQLFRSPPDGVTKREISAWWQANVARIARELHTDVMPKRPLRETFGPLAAPREGQRGVRPVQPHSKTAPSRPMFWKAFSRSG